MNRVEKPFGVVLLIGVGGYTLRTSLKFPLELL